MADFAAGVGTVLPHDAIILSGGRGSRLGGVDKGALVVAGRPLIDTAIDAVRHAGRVVVVGECPPRERVLVTRESPAHGGPVAGVVAGVEALRGEGARSAWTMLLACDLPRAQPAVELLLRSAAHGVDAQADHPHEALAQVDGWCLADPAPPAGEGIGHLQWLIGLYRTEALDRAVAEVGAGTDVSMGRLLRPLHLRGIPAPAELVADIDTPADLTDN